MGPCLLKRWYGWVALHDFDTAIFFAKEGPQIKCRKCGHVRQPWEQHQILASDPEIPDTEERKELDAK